MSTKINPCRAGQDGKFDIIILGEIKDASVFHIGHDGATIYLLSNNKTYSTLENAMAKMPTVMLEEIEEFDYDYKSVFLFES
ncbi:hypothetical protein [Paenibacillus sp. Marseille-Q4541]|uniref:hypothetical protein n=1 Tax=Paenibacillus sp. Marseille-Q4541 TaxID=2831522 RepID=UPI001BA6A9B9|nr:hypothetical protein [Paenibacillus sp. Marseille-Q4541]